MKDFEEKLERLESISEKLGNGEVKLEQAQALFEEGIALSKELEKELNSAEQKIEILTNDPDQDEEPEFETF